MKLNVICTGFEDFKAAYVCFMFLEVCVFHMRDELSGLIREGSDERILVLALLNAKAILKTHLH